MRACRTDSGFCVVSHARLVVARWNNVAFVRGRAPPAQQCNIAASVTECRAAGVIFYEMLYGRRPFHTDVSQEAIASSNLLLSPAALAFDAKPAVSQGAKDFIQKCLTYNQQARPDAREAARHEYLVTPRGSRRAPAGPAPTGAQPLAAARLPVRRGVYAMCVPRRMRRSADAALSLRVSGVLCLRACCI
jgi:Protein kinase domain